MSIVARLAVVLGLAFTPVAGMGGHARADSVNANYYCVDGDRKGYLLSLGQDTTLQARGQKETQIHAGTYGFDGSTVTLSLPDLAYSDRSTAIERHSGFLATFTTPQIQCIIIGHQRGPAVQGYANCPNIRYIPNVGWHKNAFQFYPDRSVKRRRWRELSGVDTLYKEFFGVYLIDGDRFTMLFGWGPEGERVLTGRILPDQSFTVDQLEPAKGPCRPS